MQRNYFSFTKTFFVLITGFCMQQGLAQDAMFIAPSGNVGIGTNNPAQKLTVEGNSYFHGTIYLHENLDKGISYEAASPVGGPRLFGYWGGLLGTSNGTNALFWNSAGNVGIGTTSPANKLSVEGNANFTGNVGIGTTSPANKLSVNGNANFAGNVIIGNSSTAQSMLTVKGSINYQIPSVTYYTNNGHGSVGGAGGPGNVSISIYAESNILASTFYAFSDSRIKTDFNRSDIAADLATLKQIQVTDYRYKDGFQYGNAVKKGIIAQEVEAVFPQAVNKHTDYITDIFAMPKAVSLNEKTLTVSMEKAHGLANGDMLRLITPTEVVETAVEVLDNNTFMVKDWAKDSKEVFVYGKKVEDFRAVDFDRLTILSISSIQQLCKEMEAMKNELSTCQKALLTLKDLEARVGKIEINAKPATATIE